MGKRPKRWLLVHGWGLDASFWQPMTAVIQARNLGDVFYIDLGFFSDAISDDIPSDIDIAVGHSLGFLWLLQKQPVWGQIIGVNALPRFIADVGYPAMPATPLQRMTDRFVDQPEEIWRTSLAHNGFYYPAEQASGDFQRFCHWVDGEKGGFKPQWARLHQALMWLADWDGRKSWRDQDGLILNSEHDPLVPSTLARDFLPDDRRVIHSQAGHMLPLDDPTWCIDQIEDKLLFNQSN